MHGLPNCPQLSNAPPNTHLLIFSNCAPHSNKFFCFALTKTSHRNGYGNGRRDGDGDGRRDDDTTATTVMDGAMAMATAMDGAMAGQHQRKA
jgi:hypothetical protein